MEIREFQLLMKQLYGKFDSQRKVYRTALWLGEEVGELMAELKKSPTTQNKDAIGEEMADILAWVASLANILDIDLESAIHQKYPGFCIKCGRNPCECNNDL
ncbi:MAG: nucleotide pyrophosphohydrolase [Promethearchaeia archaeon]|nr:MAG: nucleotide pyrophosphohydrolase [Candidatus Lokiarchaeia archaeon]